MYTYNKKEVRKEKKRGQHQVLWQKYKERDLNSSATGNEMKENSHMRASKCDL